MEEAEGRQRVAAMLAEQGLACERLGSVLYADLLARAAENVRAGGAAWAALRHSAHDDEGSALALRFMAAVHRLVLERRATALAAHYPSVGGTAPLDSAWPAFEATLVDHVDDLPGLVALPCQTNDVGRCAALVGGLLLIAAETSLPLSVLEIGASAGLNQHWDRYRYVDERDPTRVWGRADSPVVLRGHWEVPDELLAVTPTVTSRAACDVTPLDPTSQDGRMRLTSSVFADQVERLERLRGALAVAAATPPRVTAAAAGEWLPPRVADRPEGHATIVVHSVVWQYLTPADRAAVDQALRDEGSRATPDRPLAWLRMEPEQPLRAMGVRLTVWPGGDERLLARAGAHGFPLRWGDG